VHQGEAVRSRLTTFIAITVITVGLALPGSARAETVIDPNEPPGLKSEGVALGLSLGGTVASWAMLGIAVEGDHVVLGATGVLGAWFAPSLGHLYTDRPFTRGLAARSAGALVAMTGAWVVAPCVGRAFAGDLAPCSDDREKLSYALYGAGAVLIALGTIDDIVRAPAAVRRYNTRIRELSLAPIAGGGTTGFAVSGRF
jgi:hypothetical protein